MFFSVCLFVSCIFHLFFCLCISSLILYFLTACFLHFHLFFSLCVHFLLLNTLSVYGFVPTCFLFFHLCFCLIVISCFCWLLCLFISHFMVLKVFNQCNILCCMFLYLITFFYVLSSIFFLLTHFFICSVANYFFLFYMLCVYFLYIFPPMVLANSFCF